MRGILLSLVVAIAAGCGADEPDPPPAEDLIPDLSAPLLEGGMLTGTTVSLRALAAEGPVMINLWATWCVPCRVEVEHLKELHAEYGPRGLKIVGIDQKDDFDAAVAFIAEKELEYTILYDEEAVGMSSDAFDAVFLPANFIFDKGGERRWRRYGEIKATDSDVVNAIEQALAAAGS